MGQFKDTFVEKIKKRLKAEKMGKKIKITAARKYKRYDSLSDSLAASLKVKHARKK